MLLEGVEGVGGALVEDCELLDFLILAELGSREGTRGLSCQVDLMRKCLSAVLFLNAILDF